MFGFGGEDRSKRGKMGGGKREFGGNSGKGLSREIDMKSVGSEIKLFGEIQGDIRGMIKGDMGRIYRAGLLRDLAVRRIASIVSTFWAVTIGALLAYRMVTS